MADAPGLDRRPWPAGSWILLILLAAAALVLPAVYNRFPLIFPDTAAYLGVAYGHYWTLDRSGFYGLALKPIVAMTTPVAGLWLAIALQSIAVAGAMLLFVRRLAPGLSPWRALALVVATVLLTSLPWHAASATSTKFTNPIDPNMPLPAMWHTM